jgi:DNA-binding PadR family transcriptional regulator
MKRDRKPSAQTLSLLGVLLRQPRSWCHGYDICAATRIKSGTLYPILMRLSDRGLLEHKWQESQESGRPPRHMYRLTARGATYAREQIAENDWVTLPAGSRSPA